MSWCIQFTGNKNIAGKEKQTKIQQTAWRERIKETRAKGRFLFHIPPAPPRPFLYKHHTLIKSFEIIRKKKLRWLHYDASRSGTILSFVSRILHTTSAFILIYSDACCIAETTSIDESKLANTHQLPILIHFIVGRKIRQIEVKSDNNYDWYFTPYISSLSFFGDYVVAQEEISYRSSHLSPHHLLQIFLCHREAFRSFWLYIYFFLLYTH